LGALPRVYESHAGRQRAIIAGIDAGQAASIGLHVKFGFENVGHLRDVGLKFGRWLDVVYMELRPGRESGT